MNEQSLNNKSILVIEDEVPIADLLCYALKKEGLNAAAAYNGQDGLRMIKGNDAPDLIILDIMLPDISGIEICKEITSKYTIPVIMLTAKSDIVDKVLGLEIGADDYITKPFDIREVVARVRAALRRTMNVSNPQEGVNKITLPGSIEIYRDERKVFKKGEGIELTPKEYDLLLHLVENRGRVYTRSQLLDIVWGYDYAGDTRTVDIHIQRLRKKLDDSLIETVFGVGYKMIK